MAKTVINDDTGEEEVLYTQAELDAIKAEADAKVIEAEKQKAEKLDEFLKGKQAVELEKTTVMTAAEESKKMAEEALQRAKSVEEKAMEKIKVAEMSKYVGNDPALRAELQQAYDVLSGMPADSDEEIAARMEAAANMKGFNGPKKAIGPAMGAGYAPRFNASEDRSKDEDYQKFTGALGLQDLIPKKDN